MCSKHNLRIRWPDGAFLPIITPPEATGEDLYKMLRFAYGPKQELILLFNDLTIDKEVTLKSYGINSGDTIQAHVFTVPKDNQRMIRSIEGIAREAAKISDIKMNQLEVQQQAILNQDQGVDQISIFENSESETIIPDRPVVMSKKPLPMFWQLPKNADRKNNADPPSMLSKYNTIEEADEFFSSIGWNQWMW